LPAWANNISQRRGALASMSMLVRQLTAFWHEYLACVVPVWSGMR
jgi:hypothetical protein